MPHVSTKRARAAKLRALNPGATESQIGEMVRLSYLATDPAKRARQTSGLKLRAKRHKHTSKSITKATVSDLEHLDIITFARDILKLSLWPAQETLLRAFYGLPMNADNLGR